jgi:hypothetical protein
MRRLEITFAVSESSEGGYWARALDHPIFTQAASIGDLRAMADDAVRCHFESNSIPTRVNLVHMPIKPELSHDFTVND